MDCINVNIIIISCIAGEVFQPQSDICFNATRYRGKTLSNFNPLLTRGPFLYTLKTSENRKFSDVSSEYLLEHQAVTT